MEESQVPNQQQSPSPVVMRSVNESLRGSQIVQFYDGIGQMARMLHSATHSLDELSGHPIQDTSDLLYRQPESNFLEYVRKLTAKSTSEVLDILEKSTPAARKALQRSDSLEKQLKDYFEKDAASASNEEMVSAQQEMLDLITEQKLDLELITLSQQEILELQSFQDLSSQAITKAESMINDIEQTLASLLVSFALVSEITDDEETKDAMPLKAQEKAAEQLGQDDVDSLLSDLGF